MSAMALSPLSPVRRPAVAGLFYPADAAGLRAELQNLLEGAGEPEPVPGYPKALIVPHAGYLYSGPTAARAYDLLRPARGLVKRVVLLGPCHRVAVQGLALPGAGAFATPLGQVAVDAQAVAELKGLPQVSDFPATHAQEHSLEVQLPFLQAVLGEFQVVPLVVGLASAEAVATALERVWGGAETLIIVSSDLSHYHPYDQALAIDRASIASILDAGPALSHAQACGATPIAGLLLAAGRHGLKAQLLDYRNSGDTAGGRDRVVGYAAFAFRDPAAGDGYETHHGQRLLELARSAIGARMHLNPVPRHDELPWQREQRATFVTLMLDGRLRGCIGRLAAERALGEDIVDNACAAAFSDHRFGPLGEDEFRRCRVEVSVLSTPRRLEFADHNDLVGQLRPGQDGLIIEHEGRRGTFLPQVWEAFPEPGQFIAQLKQKAGLRHDTRSERCRMLRYRVVKWSEENFARA